MSKTKRKSLEPLIERLMMMGECRARDKSQVTPTTRMQSHGIRNRSTRVYSDIGGYVVNAAYGGI